MPRPPRCTTPRPSRRCPADKQVSARGIEVGHIFYFGTKYSEPMKARGRPARTAASVPVHMGSYGIGPSRLVAAIIEASPRRGRHHLAGAGRAVQGRDPQPQAGRRRRPMRPASSSTASSPPKGVDVLYDDRDERPGAKFATADLIGMPWQVLVGPKGLAEGKVEVKTPRRRQPRA